MLRLKPTTSVVQFSTATAATSLAKLSFGVGQASLSYQITNFECLAASQREAVLYHCYFTTNVDGE